jgi:hypothetical protein
LPVSLKSHDLVDEGVVVPRFFVAKGIVEGDGVRRGFLNDDVSVDLQQEQDGCLPGSRDAGEDVSGHGNSSHADHVDGMARWGSSRSPVGTSDHDSIAGSRELNSIGAVL